MLLAIARLGEHILILAETVAAQEMCAAPGAARSRRPRTMDPSFESIVCGRVRFARSAVLAVCAYCGSARLCSRRLTTPAALHGIVVDLRAPQLCVAVRVVQFPKVAGVRLYLHQGTIPSPFKHRSLVHYGMLIVSTEVRFKVS